MYLYLSPIKALHMDLSAILKNQQALFAFMQFLKEEGTLNQLQFCLSIGMVLFKHNFQLKSECQHILFLPPFFQFRGFQQTHYVS